MKNRLTEAWMWSDGADGALHVEKRPTLQPASCQLYVKETLEDDVFSNLKTLAFVA